MTIVPILSLPKGMDGFVIYYDAFRVVFGHLLMRRDKIISFGKLSMRSISHVEEENKELAKVVHKLNMLAI